jgi:hypothetical protein
MGCEVGGFFSTLGIVPTEGFLQLIRVLLDLVFSLVATALPHFFLVQYAHTAKLSPVEIRVSTMQVFGTVTEACESFLFNDVSTLKNT